MVLVILGFYILIINFILFIFQSLDIERGKRKSPKKERREESGRSHFDNKKTDFGASVFILKRGVQ